MPPIKEPILIGDWLADPRDDSLVRGAERLKLEPRTMRLLMRLAQAPGMVVSQDELLESVWSGLVVGPASVYQAMSQLRKVLGDVDEPPRYIETVARRGYRLIAKISKPEAPALVAPALEGEGAGPQPEVKTPAPVAKNKKPWRWVALATACGLAVLAGLWQFTQQGGNSSQMATIAVLPFIDLTEGHTQQLFCDGLTEETSNWLAQVPSLRVVARSSAFLYRDRTKDIRTIGRELQTTHVLDGSLRRVGNQVRITVQLVDTASGIQLWSETYNEEVDDVLKVQEDLARKVVGNLELRISSETDSRFAGRRSSTARAYELYLNAKANEGRADRESNELAITQYQQALQVDPSYALAKIWLAHAIGNRSYYNSRDINELLPEILPLLDEAQKIAPQLPDLYLVRGITYTKMRKLDLAERELRRALEMNPNTASASMKLGYFYVTSGQPREALSYLTMTGALDPLSYGSYVFKCIALTDLARLDEADQACQKARTLGPNSPLVYSTSSSLEVARGKWAEALKFSDAALGRDESIAELHAERARWLQQLGLMKETDEAFRQAVAADTTGARGNVPLLVWGATAAIDKGGAKALDSYVQEFGLAESDSYSTQFELANLYLIVNENAKARACVDRALASSELTGEALSDPWLARLGRSYLLIVAEALQSTGDDEGAGRRLSQAAALIDRMTDAGVRTAGIFELKAQLLAMQGRGDESVASLARAAEVGWTNVWQAEHEPYFASVRGREDFKALLAAARARNASAAAQIKSRLAQPAKT